MTVAMPEPTTAKKQRYTAVLTEPTYNAVLEHEFEGEKGLPNRILWRLLDAIKHDAAPRLQDNDDAFEGHVKNKYLYFRADPEITELIEEWRRKLSEQRGEKVSTNETLGFLLDWAAQLPVIEPLRNADEAWKFIVKQYGDRLIPIPVVDVVEALTQRCSVKEAKKWLIDLRERQLIELRLSTDQELDTRGEYGLRFEDRDGKFHQYNFMELFYGLPRTHFAQLRSLLTLKPVKRRRFKTDADVILEWASEITSPQINAAYQGRARAFLGFTCKPLTETTVEDFEGFINSEYCTSLADSTRNHTIAIVRSLLRFCDRHGVCSIDLGEQGQAENTRDAFDQMVRSLNKSTWYAVEHRQRKAAYLMLESDFEKFKGVKALEVDVEPPISQPNFISSYQQFAYDFQKAFSKLMEGSVSALSIALRDGKTTVVIVKPAIAETKLRQKV